MEEHGPRLDLPALIWGWDFVPPFRRPIRWKSALEPPPTGNANGMARTIDPIGSMVLPYMVTFTIDIPQMLAYIPYMDPMGYSLPIEIIGGTANVEFFDGDG